MLEWKWFRDKPSGTWIGINQEAGNLGFGGVVADKVGKQWWLFTNAHVVNDEVEAKYLTWRPTLQAAKERAAWAYHREDELEADDAWFEENK